MWVDLFFNTIACIGLCFVLKYGSILNPIRNLLSRLKFFEELFSCSMCLGFWSGLVIGLVTNYNPLLFPLYGCTVCWFADYILDIVIKHGDTGSEEESKDVTLLNE